MLIIFAVIVGGILCGRLLAGYNLRAVSRLITVIICLLLFLLGAEVGADPQVARGFATLGWRAFVLFVGSVAGSIALSWLLWRRLKSKNRVV